MCRCSPTGQCNCVGALTEAEARTKSNRNKALTKLWEQFERIRPYEQFEQLTIKQLIEAAHEHTIYEIVYCLPRNHGR